MDTALRTDQPQVILPLPQAVQMPVLLTRKEVEDIKGTPAGCMYCGRLAKRFHGIAICGTCLG